MIYSVGIDIIDMQRIEKAVEKWGDRFIRRLLGDDERNLYRERRNKIQFISGRFAAKEAVLKSLGPFFERGAPLRDIQILNDLYGKPYVHLEDRIRERILDKEVKISITHERTMAAAVALLTGD